MNWIQVWFKEFCFVSVGRSSFRQGWAPGLQQIYMAVVHNCLGHSFIQFIQSAGHLNNQILQFALLFVLESSEGRAEKAALFEDVHIDWLCEGVVIEEKLFKYLVGVVCEPVASFELPLLEQTLLQLQVAVAIEEGPFEGTTQHFIGLWYFREVVVCSLVVLPGKPGVPPQDQPLVLAVDVVAGGISAQPQHKIVIFDH